MMNPTQPLLVAEPNLDEVIEDPPERIFAPTTLAKPWITRRPRKFDFAELDAANRRLGKLGEEFVFELEKHRLLLAGRDDLARRVAWASRDIGDGLGFDILSFDEADDSERMLEVKATGLGKFFPFYVTSNEVRCSEDIPQQYHLYRVFDFGRAIQERFYFRRQNRLVVAARLIACDVGQAHFHKHAAHILVLELDRGFRATRRLLHTIAGEKFVTIQVTADELLLDRVRLPLEANEMLLYPFPHQAPARYPTPKPEPAAPPCRPQAVRDEQKRLWDEDLLA